MGRDTLLEANLDLIGAYHLSRIRRYELKYKNHFISTIRLFSRRKAHSTLAEADLESAETYFVGENCMVTFSQPAGLSPPVGQRYERSLEFSRGVVGTVASHLGRMIQGRPRPHLTADDLIMLIAFWEDALWHYPSVMAGFERWISGRWTTALLS
jgi:hypothetical protein